MKDGHFQSGIIGGLFEHKHYQNMGEAVWLFGWLVHRQTKETGFVLGGKPIRYEEISKDTGHPVRNLQRWVSILEKYPYIATRRTPYGLVFQVLSPKKRIKKRFAKCGGLDTPNVAVLSSNVATLSVKCGGNKEDLSVGLSSIDFKAQDPMPNQSPASEFKRFYDTYPENRRGDATYGQVEWNAIPAIDMDVEVILYGLELWKKSEEWNKENGRFVPKVTKFLRERLWKHPPKEKPQEENAYERRKRLGID